MADRVQVTLQVEGMTRDGCARHLEGALRELAGIESATVSAWQAGKGTVLADARVSDEALTRAVEAAGYRARVRERRPVRESQHFPSRGEPYDLMVIGEGSAAFAAGTFLYVGASDLLSEAHRRFNLRVVGSVIGGALLPPVLAGLTGG